jgi:RNA polymerase sigma factor (sigma-70 family)
VATAASNLSARAATLSPEQFAALFSEHSRSLWVIAAAVLSDSESARDVVQEAAIIGLRKRSEFAVGSSFAHWMGQIVRYVALNELRRRRTRDSLSHSPGARPGAARSTAPWDATARPNGVTSADPGARPSSNPGVSPFGQLIPTEDAFDDRTLRALAQLEENARACLLMKTVLSLPYRQISETLGIPENTAMSHVHRARQKMRALLEDEDRDQASERA